MSITDRPKAPKGRKRIAGGASPRIGHCIKVSPARGERFYMAMLSVAPSGLFSCRFLPGVRFAHPWLFSDRPLRGLLKKPVSRQKLVTPVLNADLRGQKSTLAEQIRVCQRFYQRFSAFQNTALSNSVRTQHRRALIDLFA